MICGECSKKREKPWYKKWFNDNYMLLYRHRNQEDAGSQARLIISTLKPMQNCRILDLACGSGRYMSFFQELGCQVMGIDLSYALIKRGKKEAPASQLVIGDMQTLPLLPATFDMVLSLFTSFGYFEADEENQAVILSVYQTLKPGGYYWLDFLNAHCVIDNLVPETLSHVSTQLLAREKRKIEAGRIIKDIYFENEDQEVIEHYQESVRLFTRHDLEKMMEAARFQVLGCFGNYQGESWGENSPRTIIYGKKE